MEQTVIEAETPNGDVAMAGPAAAIEEIRRRCNAFDSMCHALVAWRTLAEESMSFRLALTNLSDNIGVQLLEMTQEALGIALGEEDVCSGR